jgi:cytoskeletal protein CcmA (bactofilin family)
VDLLKTGRLRGNITTPSLSVERGALFQGESKMDDRGEHKPPTTFQPPPEVPKTVQ